MKKHCLITFFTVVLLIHFYQQVHSQQFNYKLEDLTDHLGLSNYYFSNIIQDKQGYLWISTLSEGLIKFDGYTSTRYLYQSFNPHSLGQNTVYTFVIENQNEIWLGTPEGLCKFNPSTEKFTRYDSSLIPGMPYLGNVSAIAIDDQGYLWIGNFEGKLWRYNRQKNTFTSFTSMLKYQEEKGLLKDFHEAINCILKDKKGNIWVGNTVGLHRIFTKAEKIEIKHYKHDPNNVGSLGGNLILNLFEDGEGFIWILSNNILNRYDPKTEKFTRYFPKPSDPFSFSGFNVWGSLMVEDGKGNLWIANNNGIVSLNKERNTFTHYPQNRRKKYDWFTNNISVALAGNNILMGSPDGLQSINLEQKAFGLLKVDSLTKNTLTDNSITAISRDKWDNIWIGTSNGGLNRWNIKTGEISNISYRAGKPGGLLNNTVTAILENPDSTMWIANGEYLSLLNTKTGASHHLNTNVRNLADNDAKYIFSLCKTSDGLIWMGTGNGIKSYNPITEKFVHYFYESGNPEGISDYTVLAIQSDSLDNIWVGTNSIAFNKFNKKTGKFTHYKNNARDTNSISSNIVTCIFIDSKKNLWIGTVGGGICRYNYHSDNFHTPGRNQQLPWNSVFSIQEDNNGNIWMGTNMGLSCYITSKDEFVNYDEQDGLQSNYFASNATRIRGSSFKDENAVLYFGGEKGLTYFDPSRIHPNDYIPPIVITQFKIFDKLQPGRNLDSVITLTYNQNFFSFEFAALNYTNSSKNKYAYQLTGFDPEWIYSGSRRYAGYTNLAPGEYYFKVKGSNNDGIWNEKGVTVKIIILPPWWRTWWAYAVYGLILISGIWLVHRYQKRRVILAEREKAQKKELEQAKEIEKAYQELQRTQTQLVHAEKMASLGELTAGIAHEIQNPLNFVNNFSEVNKELLEELKEEMAKGNVDEVHHISNNIIANEDKINQHCKRADAIVKGMLQHSRSSTGIKESVNINELAEEYLRLAYHGMRAKDKSFHCHIASTLDPNAGKLNLVPQEIGRVLVNLINNAFYAVHEKSQQKNDGYEPSVILATKRNSESVEISIHDNGSGIPENIVKKIFQPFFTTKPTGIGTGLGLSLTYDIIKAHDGNIRVETKPGQGSVFIIELPKGLSN